MKKMSERGQIALVALLALALLVGVAFFAVSTSLKGMEQGANTIGNTVGDAIDNAEAQDRLNLDWQVQNGTVVTAWVNQQRIYPNKHSVESHGEYVATQAANCYNDHGVFFIQANKRGDWYFHCLEEDNKTVRTTYWVKDGNKFHMQSAYTKGDGNWSWQQIRSFFEQKWGATKATFPSDGVLYIDGIPAPYLP